MFLISMHILLEAKSSNIKRRKIVAALKDEKGNPVMSEKVMEIHMDGGKAVKARDQFGIGRVSKE